MHLRRTALVALMAFTVGACSSAGSTPTAAPTSPSPAAAASATGAATRIEVELTDALQILPTSMTVPAGTPITFVVTNTGTTEHEFYLGDEAAQAEHEAEMQSMGGMTHDEPEGIALAPGETKELTYTFSEPGLMLAGCHVAGHDDGGMKADTVQG